MEHELNDERLQGTTGGRTVKGYKDAERTGASLVGGRAEGPGFV